MKITNFTIVAVCFDTKEIFYRDFLESVVAQDYDNWEMYILDCDYSSNIERITQEFFPSDTRVHYRKLTKRNSKAYGTNIGFHFAEGDYVVLTDCHNRLDPHCLYYIAEYIVEMENVDVIYSDHIDIEGLEKTKIHVKQDFNKELFLRNNYLGDLLIFNRDVIRKVGQVHEVLTEAYMYDYLIRCMEKRFIISHIPKFLYYKRIMSSDIYPDSVDDGEMQSRTQASLSNSAIVGIVRSIFPGFMKNPVTGKDIDKRELIYKESMACVKAYLARNNIDAKLSEDPLKRFWKLEYEGAGAEYHTKDYILLRGEGVKVSGRHFLDKMYGFIKQPQVAVVGVRFAKPFWTTENCGYIYDTQGNAYPAFYNTKLRDAGYENLQLIPREIGLASDVQSKERGAGVRASSNPLGRDWLS